MDATAFYTATVPAFRHYLAQLDHLLSCLPDDRPDILNTRLTEDGFTAGEHLQTAQGFVLRAMFPLLGRTVPDLSADPPDPAGLRRRGETIQSFLRTLRPSDFDRTASRTITHTAGMAELTQPAGDFVTLFALPNFFFHLTMGYATLRQAGVALGKADFDGLHSYPPGFRFAD